MLNLASLAIHLAWKVIYLSCLLDNPLHTSDTNKRDCWQINYNLNLTLYEGQGHLIEGQTWESAKIYP